MHLTIRHLTAYRYSEPVVFGEHRMMFRPRAGHDLRLLSSQLTISPRPQSIRWLHDVFDNSLAVAAFSGPATDLRFDSVVSLEHVETTLPDYLLEECARTYPFRYANEELPDLARGLSHHYPSGDVKNWAEQFSDASRTTETISLLRSITVAIKNAFGYEMRNEKGIQSPSETLRRGRGSCRDFALLMMEAARSLGARGSHLPGAGWVDFDPTNNIVGNRNLIRVAVAWNPKHALPLGGTFIGAASSFLEWTYRSVSRRKVCYEHSRGMPAAERRVAARLAARPHHQWALLFVRSLVTMPDDRRIAPADALRAPLAAPRPTGTRTS